MRRRGDPLREESHRTFNELNNRPQRSERVVVASSMSFGISRTGTTCKETDLSIPFFSSSPFRDLFTA